MRMSPSFPSITIIHDFPHFFSFMISCLFQFLSLVVWSNEQISHFYFTHIAHYIVRYVAFDLLFIWIFSLLQSISSYFFLGCRLSAIIYCYFYKCQQCNEYISFTLQLHSINFKYIICNVCGCYCSYHVWYLWISKCVQYNMNYMMIKPLKIMNLFCEHLFPVRKNVWRW